MVSKDNEPTIAQRMKGFRLDHRWTLERMARKTGLSIMGVWLIENGKTNPHELTIAKIKAKLPEVFEEKAS